MDPLFHTYNGVPQESKLATYMKRQTEGPPLPNSLSKNLSSLTLNDALAVSLKKTIATANDFIPRSSPALHFSNSTSPLTVTSQLKNSSPTPTVPTYQEYVGGTTYFYSTNETVGNEEDNSIASGVTLFPGTPAHTKTAMAQLEPVTDPSFFIPNQLRLEIQHKNNLTLMQPDPTLYPDLPPEVDNYHDLVPLEPLPGVPKSHLVIPYQTSTYKATHVKTGLRYCLRRVHNFRLPSSKCMILVDMWKKLTHSNIIQLREVFTTKAFGDQSMVFVYDYHPDSETLLSRYFTHPESINGYTDSFSSNPNAPRPYSHSKNSLLRQQHTNSMLPEATLWSYVIQLTGVVSVVHGANLACRILDPSKVLLTGKHRLRVSSVGILDLLTYDSSSSSPLTLIPHYQQEDLSALGKLLLALGCRSLMAVQRDNLQTSLDLMSRTYSTDLRNVILYLLTSKQVRTVVDLMPMIGARYYAQLDRVQYQNDVLYSELAKEMENGRLCRLLIKLGTINERPELNMDPSWSETGDRYMLKLFRDHVFHQVTEDGRPFLDMAHVIHCLNKLDAGTQEKVCLMSRDEQSVLVVTYAELKACLEQSFNDIVASTHKNSALE